MGAEDQPTKAILVATDFSETARLGLDWAAYLAGVRSAKLVVLHALAPPIPLVLDVEFSLPEPDAYEILSSAAHVQMEALIAELQAAGMDAEGKVEVARHLANVMPEVEEDVGAELLVIGSRGLTAFRHLVMGSNAEEAIRRSRCPVLVVHPGDRTPAHAPRRILVATDFSEDADAAIEAALHLLGPSVEHSQVVLLHSVEIRTDWTFMVGMEVPPPALREKLERELLRELEARAERLRDRVAGVEVKLSLGNPSEVVVEEAKSQDVDLIVLGAHGHGALDRIFLGSTAVRIVQHAPCPVFAYRGCWHHI